MIVRPAIERDAPAIARIHVVTWQVAYRGQLPDAYLDGLSVERHEAMWRNRLATKGHPSRCIWVASSGGTVVGFAVTGDTRDEVPHGQHIGELYAIYVDPDHWGSGAGRELIERVAIDMTQQGYDAATLWTLETNERTRRFYEANGWYLDGARKTESVGGAAAVHVRFRLDLATASPS